MINRIKLSRVVGLSWRRVRREGRRRKGETIGARYRVHAARNARDREAINLNVHWRRERLVERGLNSAERNGSPAHDEEESEEEEHGRYYQEITRSF